MKLNIFLDDKRTIDMSRNSLGITDWTIVRDDLSFKKLIDDNFDDIDLISFDHDLALVTESSEFTGKTACELVIDKCLSTGKKFPNWYVHTDNVSGAGNIVGLILNYLDKVEGVDISDYKYFHRGMINGEFIK